jgi:anti-sigma regulatory factor (Ser/Thr protein kinase)
MNTSTASCPMKSTFLLPAIAASAGLARSLTRNALVAQSATAVDTAELLVSELVTNALLHASSTATLQIDTADGRIRISVHDDSALSPHVRAAALDATGGRGLLLVEALATDWGWESTVAGKRVWFEL